MEKEIIKNISLEAINQLKNIPEISRMIKIIQGIGIALLAYFVFLIIMKFLQYKRLSKIPEIYNKVELIEKKLERIESKLDKKSNSKKQKD